MKRFIAGVVIAAAGLAVLQAQVQADEYKAGSSVGSVVVFLDRALVTRRATVDVTPVWRILFDGLPERTEAASLQVRGTGKAVIDDTTFQTRYYAAIPDERIQALLAVKDEKEAQIQARSDRVARSKSEKAFLEKIASKATAAGEEGNSTLDPAAWAQMLAFYRDRLAALDEEIRAAERESRALKQELDKVNLELSQVQAGRQKKKQQAVVSLNVKEAGPVALELSYLVYGPSWRPSYDLRVDSVKKTLDLTLGAIITQNTGEDWGQVSLALSTARTDVGGRQPELSAWYLRVLPPPRQESQKSAAAPSPRPAPAPAQMFAAESAASALAPPEAEPLVDRGASAETGALAVVFKVPGGSTIASDNVQHRVVVTGASYPAYFRYSTAPKLSPYAYLKAKAVNAGEFPFLPGPAKVFLDGSFVADSSMDLVPPGAEFWTFLGVDESVKVDYKLVKKYRDDQGLFEKKNRFIFQYETVISNKKKVDAEIVLWDQIPQSTDQRILVKLLDPKYAKDSEALKKNNQDIFEWLLQLKPGESRKIGFSYSVEYPVDTEIEGL